MKRSSSAPGEPDAMPQDVAAQLRAIGARIEPGATAAVYAPMHAPRTDDVRIVRDEPYGPHGRNVLDVFVPDGTRTDRKALPVVVFIHGGGFTRGAKTQDGLPFYDNVMLWAARNGLVGANINYRLAPDSVWPSGIEDVAAAVDWLRRNAGEFGGDRDRIFLWGHSAGAAHAADYIARQAASGRPAGIAGAVLTSGFYALGNEVSVWQAYYGDDVALYAERSSLAALASSDVPLLVNDAELDPENFRSQARLLVEARERAGNPVEYVHLLGHSHISETYAVGTQDTTLSGEVLRFVQQR